MKSDLAIATLIRSRLTELGLSRGEFVKRLGSPRDVDGSGEKPGFLTRIPPLGWVSTLTRRRPPKRDAVQTLAFV
jgi:hypothetical protein